MKDIEFKKEKLVEDIGLNPVNGIQNTYNVKDGIFVKKDSLDELYSELPLICPDSVLRKSGDTTFFTSAGIQHLETLNYNIRDIGKGFCIYQPCIRSQYMDNINEGSSSSFVNFSAAFNEADEKTFAIQTKKLISYLIAKGISPERIRLILEERKDKDWGKRHFQMTDFSVFIDDCEVGMVNFMHDFPCLNGEKSDIVEVGIGMERLNWKLEKNSHYFPGFDYFYKNSDLTVDESAQLIDPIRTATLITMLGILPSLKNQGYRTRMLSKRFISRKGKKEFNVNQLIETSYMWWLKQGVKSKFNLNEIQDILTLENMRNSNDLLRQKLKEKLKIHTKLDINVAPSEFISKIQKSVPKKDREALVQFIKKGGQYE